MQRKYCHEKVRQDESWENLEMAFDLISSPNLERIGAEVEPWSLAEIRPEQWHSTDGKM